MIYLQQDEKFSLFMFLNRCAIIKVKSNYVFQNPIWNNANLSYTATPIWKLFLFCRLTFFFFFFFKCLGAQKLGFEQNIYITQTLKCCVTLHMNEKHILIYKYFKIFFIFNLPFLVSDSLFLFGELGCLLNSIVI